MWQGFTIALREGIESFLAVAVTALYLLRTGRRALLPAVWLGVGASVAVCAAAGYLLSRVPAQSLWEGVLAFAAAALVGSLLVYMRRASSSLRKRIEARIDGVAAPGTPASGFWGIFFLTVFLVSREGMETALLIDSALFQLKDRGVLIGLGIGIFAAAAVGFAWIRLGRRIDFGAILKLSSLFLALFLVQLSIAGFHELAEAGVWPNSAALHDATEAFGPDGKYGRWLAYALAAVPSGWLIFAWLKNRRAPSEDSKPRRAAQGG